MQVIALIPRNLSNEELQRFLTLTDFLWEFIIYDIFQNEIDILSYMIISYKKI